MAAAQPLAGRPAWRGLGTDPGNRQLSVSSWRRLAAQQIVELKLRHEQERTHLFQQHNAEKDSLVLDHQREIDSSGQHSRATTFPHETQTQEWRTRDSQAMMGPETEGHARLLLQLARTDRLYLGGTRSTEKHMTDSRLKQIEKGYRRGLANSSQIRSQHCHGGVLHSPSSGQEGPAPRVHEEVEEGQITPPRFSRQGGYKTVMA
ncbi:hypothetical protein AAFF_G00407620 [Aldrovandia affinis]|uniref:Uncharacterized protein n=1 Tax=Aldrovandia affinis TaxID=143900 RepID=A0AAD7WJX6_9TELE|nr:hypothetical protein AAFF_G00407620 [Aldrovandia affinis]